MCWGPPGDILIGHNSKSHGPQEALWQGLSLTGSAAPGGTKRANNPHSHWLRLLDSSSPLATTSSLWFLTTAEHLVCICLGRLQLLESLVVLRHCFWCFSLPSHFSTSFDRSNHFFPDSFCKPSAHGPWASIDSCTSTEEALFWVFNQTFPP